MEDGEILGIKTVSDLNAAVAHGRTHELINVAEALQERHIIHITEQIAARPQARVILIAGPSSSGKTTFSKRLAIQLMASGAVPYTISLDDYFVEREQTPKDENGEYDFETLYALDIPYFEAHILRLLEGGEVEMPRFNFKTGKREQAGVVKLSPQHLLILEGIHALNPELTKALPPASLYRIYVSPLTTIPVDNHHCITNTDNRLLRRIIRDYKYRGYSAQETLGRWHSVRAGEDRWICPYKELADAMFNSSLLFELAILRDQVLPVLEQVPEDAPESAEARRLKHLLSFISPMPLDCIPPTSLLREFLGGSTFSY